MLSNAHAMFYIIDESCFHGKEIKFIITIFAKLLEFLKDIKHNKPTYLGSVIRKISRANRPINVAERSLEGSRGIGTAVDWNLLCQSWI